MKDFSDHVIPVDSSILDALAVLNNLKDTTLTLFVVDGDILRGTLTDGDIRRAILNRLLLSDNVQNAMNKNFHYLSDATIGNIAYIKQLKSKGVDLLPLIDNKGRIKKIYDLTTLKSLLPIDAVLMAGGKGERLRPLTEKTPKPLLPIGKKLIIDYNIDSLIDYGISQINVTVNYLKEQIEEHFRELRNGIQINCIQEPCYLGTIGSIKFVETFHNDTVLVMNSDLFTNINYEDYYLHFLENEADMSVAAVPYSVSVPYGIFDLDGRNIQGIKEKPSYNYYANAGIYLIKRHLLDLIPDNIFFNATDFIELLISKNYKVIRFPLTGYWIDIGKHEEYNKAKELVKHL